MKLPAFEDLSKEQDLIYNLDLDGNYLVSGPPGTGKSVMALYRAQALTIDEREPDVLMYSNVLQQYTEQAAEEIGVESFVTTFHKWFWRFWRTHYGGRPPTLEGNSFAIDFGAVVQMFMADPPQKGQLTDLIVDEGQDLAVDFYRMARYTAQNITVFADENQKIVEENTTLREIEKAIGASEHLELRRNYRNTAEIAAVAAHYYAGAPTGKPDPPERHGDKPILKNFPDLNDFVGFVARYAAGRTNLNIGIACPTSSLQRKLLNRLQARNLRIRVQTYIGSSKDHKDLDFDEPAITIVNYRSLKGLEFDTLFVPEIQQVTMDPTSAVTRMMFYVAMSRARDELHLSWSGDGPVPPILDGLSGLVEQQ